MNQGSRLSAVRLAKIHSADQLLGIGAFTEDTLYLNLKWLSKKQQEVEDALFRKRSKEETPSLFLYDVTSSYLEGTQNAFGTFGYNRDGKKGKKQIVIGMLCDQSGYPLTVEVFPGNTQDPSTVANQIRKVAERFGAKDVTFVGDRGMIKNKQITDLIERKFHYITAITKPQMETLIKQEVIQLGLFDTELVEVTDNNIRYILRRNPVRANEIKESRESKLASVETHIQKQNQYLLEHPKAKVETAKIKIDKIIAKVRMDKYLSIEIINRKIKSLINDEILIEETKLDGCYIIKTDLTVEQASKETVHSRYKDLAMVENVFRTSKTELEMQPIFVRKEESTRAHAFIVMLAFQIIKKLREEWKNLDLTVQEGLYSLNQLCLNDVFVKDSYAFTSIPMPRKDIKELFDCCNFTIPKAIKLEKSAVSTNAKLNIGRQLPDN